MIGERDLSNASSNHGSEGSKSLEPAKQRPDSGQNLPNLDDKTEFTDKGSEPFGESESDRGGFLAKPSNPGNSASQELSISRLGENGTLDFSSGAKISPPPPNSKGKEVVVEDSSREEKWVERDFLQLSGGGGGSGSKEGASSKRDLLAEGGEDVDRDGDKNRDKKKAKMETLNLSLALPDVSLSLAPSNAAAAAAAAPPPPNDESSQQVPPLKSSRSIHALITSNNNNNNNNAQTSCSNDFTAASLSYSFSVPYSHNPSCSLTRNSTENYDYSVGSHRREHDQIWHCGEGTNGSVHSRFRPAGGDGIGLSGHRGSLGHTLMNGGGSSVNRDLSNSFYKAASSDNVSFLPSELPARSLMVTMSGDSKARSLDQLDPSEDRAPFTFSRQAKIVMQCVSEPLSVMDQILRELTDEAIDSAKAYLKDLIEASEGKRELLSLQRQLDQRSDLTKETLSKAHRAQLEILAAVKLGFADFVSKRTPVPTTELIEIFLLMRCRNINCGSLLPVDDCECKICSSQKGFCNQCMCPICFNFDCANNTCSWVGCDVCSHWCHASCAIEKKLIRPGPSLKGLPGTTEMQFHCLGCGHASAMLGFVKDVFVCCANDWSLQTLLKELDCVGRIFKGSEDVKGKALYLKVQEAIYRLERNRMSPSEACSSIFQFFNSSASASGSASELPTPTMSSKDLLTIQSPIPVKTIYPLSFTNHLPSSTSVLRDVHHPISSALNDKPSHMVAPRTSDTSRRVEAADIPIMSGGDIGRSNSSTSGGLDSLESIVKMKEAEARMFQKRADDARREAEEYHQVVRAKLEKLDEEYAEKLAKLCLQETEERRRKKLEELKHLESSHCMYYNMKLRMQAEIAGLLERMEATKKELV